MWAAFRGSEAVAAGRATWGELAGPGFVHVGHDLYVPAGTALDHRARIGIASVRGGPSTVVTGWSATVLRGLDVLPYPEPPVEVAVVDRCLRSVADTMVRRQRFPDGETTVRHGLRTTTSIRTAFDLATRVATDDAVVAADALGRVDGFHGVDLAAFASAHPGARGVRRVARIARLMDPGAMSPPETRVRLGLLRAGLPAPVLQHEVFDEHRRVAQVDMAWIRYRVALEYDGRHHAEDDRRGRDIDRIEDLRALGWHVIVVTKRQARQPGWIAERVRAALVSRGWR